MVRTGFPPSSHRLGYPRLLETQPAGEHPTTDLVANGDKDTMIPTENTRILARHLPIARVSFARRYISSSVEWGLASAPIS